MRRVRVDRQREECYREHREIRRKNRLFPCFDPQPVGIFPLLSLSPPGGLVVPEASWRAVSLATVHCLGRVSSTDTSPKEELESILSRGICKEKRCI